MATTLNMIKHCKNGIMLQKNKNIFFLPTFSLGTVLYYYVFETLTMEGSLTLRYPVFA